MIVGSSIGYTPPNEWTTFILQRPQNPANYIVEHDATYVNTCPAGFIEDPEDSSKMIMYRAEFLGAITVGARISAFTFDKSDPYTLVFDSIVLTGSENAYDINGCRFGWPIWISGTLYYYYVGVDENYKWRICRASTTDGRTFTKLGVVLDYNDVDEKSVSGPSIHFYNGTYYMIYTGWDGVGVPLANNNPGFSHVGIKLATSSDGVTWVKGNKVIIPLGTGNALDAGKVEDGILFRIKNTWVILYSCDGGPGTDAWSIQMAYCDLEDPNNVFTKIHPYFGRGALEEDWDNDLVACPYIYDFNGLLLMYYQGGNQGASNIFDIGAAPIEIP